MAGTDSDLLSLWLPELLSTSDSALHSSDHRLPAIDILGFQLPDLSAPSDFPVNTTASTAASASTSSSPTPETLPSTLDMTFLLEEDATTRLSHSLSHSHSRAQCCSSSLLPPTPAPLQHLPQAAPKDLHTHPRSLTLSAQELNQLLIPSTSAPTSAPSTPSTPASHKLASVVSVNDTGRLPIMDFMCSPRSTSPASSTSSSSSSANTPALSDGDVAVTALCVPNHPDRKMSSSSTTMTSASGSRSKSSTLSTPSSSSSAPHVPKTPSPKAGKKTSGASRRRGSAKTTRFNGMECPVCHGPGRNSDKRICGVCYSGLYNDVTKLARSVKLTVSGNQAKDLQQLKRGLQELARGCKNSYQCTKKRWVYSLAPGKKCTRCRSLQVIDEVPTLAQSMLWTFFGS
eukprot:m.288326 g.288326  ORF g.288326 m.288326 type:complete len:401 (+) comp15801_c1_seq4:277-1479(+)